MRKAIKTASSFPSVKKWDFKYKKCLYMVGQPTGWPPLTRMKSVGRNTLLRDRSFHFILHAKHFSINPRNMQFAAAAQKGRLRGLTVSREEGVSALNGNGISIRVYILYGRMRKQTRYQPIPPRGASKRAQSPTPAFN